MNECFVVGTFTVDRCFDVARLLNSLSLQISCKFSFPIVGIKISSVPAFALKYSNRKFTCGD
jgi:hypothetical protein